MTAIDNALQYWRQQGIVPTTALSSIPVTVIGAGGIGSLTVRNLAKMGVTNIEVYDDDSVELHNLPNQGYWPGSLGKLKVEALADIVKTETGIQITAHNAKFTDQPLRRCILVSAVDSMSQRKEIWKRARYNTQIPFYIEGRMGGQTLRIYSFNPCMPQVISWYEKNMLYSDAEALELPCTERAIIYTSDMIASFIAHLVSEFVTGKRSPWETIFDFPTRQFIVYP